MFLDNYKIIDLTQPLLKNVPTWSGSCGFHLEIKKDYDQLFRVNELQMEAGIGTHVDAPSHLIRGGFSIENISLNHLVTQTCVIDVSKKAKADYEITLEDIHEYEKIYGFIPVGCIVIFYTGWSRFWKNPEAYRNADVNGQMHFPAISAKAAEELLKRDVAGIAIDTLSPDCLNHDFPVHRLILGANKFIIENIGDCSQIPSKGATLIALPLRIETATESPLRIISLIPK